MTVDNGQCTLLIDYCQLSTVHCQLLMSYPILRRVVAQVYRSRVTVEHPEHFPPSGGVVLAANHQGSMDPQALWYAFVGSTHRKLFTIAKASLRLALWPFARWLGILFINPLHKSGVLGPAIEVVKKGGAVLLFPEGKRNIWSKTELLPGKTGVARVALATSAPVIPIGVRSRTDHGFLAGVWSFISGTRVTLTIGEPLQFPIEHDPTKERLETVTREVMQTIGRLSNRTYPH